MQTYRGSGPGGQNRNKRNTCVRLIHVYGITVTCCETRSQHMNRQIAEEKLNAILAEKDNQPIERIPTKKSKRQRAVELRAKRHRSLLKRSRCNLYE